MRCFMGYVDKRESLVTEAGNRLRTYLMDTDLGLEQVDVKMESVLNDNKVVGYNCSFTPSKREVSLYWCVESIRIAIEKEEEKK